MNISPAKLEGVMIIETRVVRDERGEFLKVFHKQDFENLGLATNFEESYYSTSKKGVIRGMHFQLPPKDHAKLVYVTAGKILDVILDIRRGSPTYGQYMTIELSEENRQAVYIPQGFAHGFLAQTDNATVTYLQTTMHDPAQDAGIHTNSIGFAWPVENPTLSGRDQKFQTLADFVSPFTYSPTA